MHQQQRHDRQRQELAQPLHDGIALQPLGGDEGKRAQGEGDNVSLAVLKLVEAPSKKA